MWADMQDRLATLSEQVNATTADIILAPALNILGTLKELVMEYPASVSDNELSEPKNDEAQNPLAAKFRLEFGTLHVICPMIQCWMTWRKAGRV